jgi:hypothetical protein
VNHAAPFIARPLTTTLAIGIALVGLFAFVRLPVAPASGTPSWQHRRATRNLAESHFNFRHILAAVRRGIVMILPKTWEDAI